MNDIERAIEVLKYYKPKENELIHERDATHKDRECFDLAISALEKQIPKKPVFHEETEEDYKSDTCPRCGEYLSISVTLYEYKYCFDCGQKLDWEEKQ